MPQQQVTVSHYAMIANHYNHAFFHGDSIHYQKWMLKKVLHHLQLTPSDQVVDLGCGTGTFTSALYDEANLNQDILGVDSSPAMLKPANTLKGVMTHCADAVSFAQLNEYQYDKVLMMGVIHHIEPDNLPTLYNGLYRQLRKGGKLLTVTRPAVVHYPFFQAALDIWPQSQLDSKIYVKLQQNAGFRVNCQTYDYPVTISKKDWFEMIKNRFWSIFSHFNDEELQAGLMILEREYIHVDILQFVDTLVFLEALRV